MPTLPTYADVVDAAERLAGHAHRTPVLTSRTADDELGAQVFFKCENFQRMGAFKFRGAFNALSRFDRRQREAGVVAFSSGNHAQAIALSARLLGMPATIVMPHDAPASKVAATRGYGGDVVIYDRYREDREAIGRRLAEERGMTLIPPYDHADVIAGQGTAAKELFDEIGPLDALFVCLGGGGLLSGSALATRALSPACKLYGVEPEAGNDAQQSFRTGAIVRIDTPQTIADGAQTQSLGQPDVRDHPARRRRRADRDRRRARRRDALLRLAHEDDRRADRRTRLCRGAAHEDGAGREARRRPDQRRQRRPRPLQRARRRLSQRGLGRRQTRRALDAGAVGANVAVLEVVVDEPHRLHERIDGGRPDEGPAALAQVLRHRGRLRRRAEREQRRMRHPARPRAALRLEAPCVRGQRSELAPQLDHAARVVDRRFDLAAMAHDAGIAEQAGDVVRIERGDPLGIEAGEAVPERLALVQDRQPAQAGLEALEAQLFEQPRVVGDRKAPFRVVIAPVERCRPAPGAAPRAVLAFEQSCMPVGTTRRGGGGRGLSSMRCGRRCPIVEVTNTPETPWLDLLSPTRCARHGALACSLSAPRC